MAVVEARRAPWFLLVLVMLGAACGGCGGSGSQSPSASAPGASGGAGGALVPPASIPRFAYVPHGGSILVGALAAVGDENRLRAVTRIPLSPGVAAADVVTVTVGNGSFLYVADSTGGRIFQYSIDPVTGNASPLTPSAVNLPPGATTPTVLRAAGGGRYLYALCSSGHVAAFGLRPDGVLVSLTSPVSLGGTAGFVANQMVVSSSGRVYVATQDSRQDHAIFGFDVGTEGHLSPLPGSPFPAGNGTRIPALALDSTGSRLYACPSPDDRIGTFEVRQDGSLASRATTLAPGALGITVDSSDRIVYAVNTQDAAHPGGSISSFSVGTDGVLTPLATVPLWYPPAPASAQGNLSYVAHPTEMSSTIALDPTGGRLLVLGGGIWEPDGAGSRLRQGPLLLEQCQIHADGSLSLQPAASLAGALGPAFVNGTAPAMCNPQFAYAVNRSESTITSYAVGSDGSLATTAAATATGASPITTTVVAVPGGSSPTGKFLFAVNLLDNTISGYPVAGDGTLGARATTPVGHGGIQSPLSLTSDLTGRFLYAVNSGAPSTVSTFRIQPDGTLVSLGAAVSTSVDYATQGVLSPLGTTLAVAHDLRSRVTLFSVDTNTGELTLQETRPWPSHAAGLAFTPDDSHFLVASPSGPPYLTEDTVLGVSSPTSTVLPHGPQVLAVDPLGFLLFGVVIGANEVTQLTLTQDGNFTPTLNGAAPCGISPAWVTVDPSNRFVYTANDNNGFRGPGRIGANRGTISQFRIGADGTLTPLTPAQVDTGLGPVQIVVTGNWQ